MTETPIERAAREHYVSEAARLGYNEARALEIWRDPDLARWRDLKIASMTAAIVEYEAANAQERRKTCKHPRQTGSGSISSDGSGSSTWFCPDCGAHEERTWPPRSEGPMAVTLDQIGR